MRAGSAFFPSSLSGQTQTQTLRLTFRAIVRFSVRPKPIFPKAHFPGLLLLLAPETGRGLVRSSMTPYNLPQREACGPSFIKSGLLWPFRFTMARELKFQLYPDPTVNPWTTNFTLWLCFLICKMVMMEHFSACLTVSEVKMLMLPHKSH